MAKTVSSTAVHFAVAFSVAYALTGSVLGGGIAALIEPVINVIAHQVHERLWEVADARQARLVAFDFAPIPVI